MIMPDPRSPIASSSAASAKGAQQKASEPGQKDFCFRFSAVFFIKKDAAAAAIQVF
jgi:hypothetical protein